MTAVVVLETFSRVTPLAVRLRDDNSGRFVSRGLTAVVWPKLQPELTTWGVLNHQDIFVFNNLPGLRAVEQGSGDDTFWSSQTAQFDFVLQVTDPSGRWLPFTMDVKVPQRRVLGIALTSPLSSPPAIQIGTENGALPIFPSVSALPPDAMGVLRAELLDAGTGQPAAWAIVEAKAGEQRLMRGLADSKGRVMVPLLYPKPVITLGSPGTTNTPLTQQSWAVDITVRYRRRQPAPEVPDLVDVLTQPAATAWSDLSPATPLGSGTLQFGRELRLFTRDAGGAPMPALLITPAGSPP